METQRTTLSFLTESKSSAVGVFSMRRVAMILLVMLLTTASVWAQFSPTIYRLYLNDNYQGGGMGMVDVPISNPTYTLTSDDEPTREGYTFLGWSTSSTGKVEYCTNEEITLTGNTTLYAVWHAYKLTYTITNENLKQAELSGYEGDKPEGTLNIPASVTIDDVSYSVTCIGAKAFQNCSGLSSVTIPNSVTSIGNSAFGRCSGLKSVTIPTSVTSIGNSAFYYCISLASVTIPNSVTNIGDGAFEVCVRLKSVTILNGVTSIGNSAFFACSGLESVTIPNSVTSIGNSAFHSCSSLESVTIPNSVTSIGDGAFHSCNSLQSVTIPNSVTSINDFAFADCNNLTSVTLNSNPKIGTGAFENTPATVAINLTASEIGNDYWTTFYNDGYNFQADENTTVYKGTVNGSSLMLTEVADRIVNSGTAVILKSTGNPVMTLTDSESSDTNGNDLRGISDRTLRTDVIANITDANAIYTMGNTSAGFGFHKYTGEYVPAGKAFLPLNMSNGAKAILTMVFADMTTGVSDELRITKYELPVYDLNGRKVSENNQKPGVYVKNGKKIMIK